MPDLTPMTRQEKFLNGDTDLEPITRREYFYAGRESELPEGHQEPETREEWFIKEYRGGGGGDITVESLSVTSNGTYTAPSGKAYSPVEVDVPLPQNAYLLKSVANLPQAIASFNDGEEMVMPTLKVAIEPQQEGSGNPSPTNVRPISGWDVAVVTVADDAESPTTSHAYTIDLDGTRYGGQLDVVSGVLTVDRKYLTIDDFNSASAGTSAGGLHWFDVNYKPEGKLGNKNICSICAYVQNGWASTITVMSVGISATIPVRIYDSSESLSDFKNKYPNLQLVYELATPLTIQRTPTQVNSLLGSNNVWANTGNIKDADYFSKEV